LQVIDHTNYFEVISIQMMIDQFYRFGKMIPICDNYFGVILRHSQDYGAAIRQRIYFLAIYHCAYTQKTEQYLVSPGNDDMVRRRNSPRFDSQRFEVKIAGYSMPDTGSHSRKLLVLQADAAFRIQ
jgi:hypothetical protein